MLYNATDQKLSSVTTFSESERAKSLMANWIGFRFAAWETGYIYFQSRRIKILEKSTLSETENKNRIRLVIDLICYQTLSEMCLYL